MLPAEQHVNECVINQSFFLEHVQDIGPEQFGKLLEACLRHDKEVPAFGKQTIGSKHMQMRMPACIVTEGLDSHYKPRDTFSLAQR